MGTKQNSPGMVQIKQNRIIYKSDFLGCADAYFEPKKIEDLKISYFAP